MSIHESKKCNKCSEVKTAEGFYRRRSGTDLSPYCKPCTKKQVIDRQRAFKEKCVAYKGGECEKCEYSECIAALEFHHKDATKKDFTIAQARQSAFNKKIKLELDKCLLLCANCHREEHYILRG